MSAALYIVADREVPGLDASVNGTALAALDLSRELDRLAQRAGVRPLMEFFSIAPEEAAAFIEDAGGEVPEEGLAAEQWFPAEDGLATVRGLLNYIAASPRAVAKSKAIISELREFETVLSNLADEGVRWHLAVDY